MDGGELVLYFNVPAVNYTSSKRLTDSFCHKTKKAVTERGGKKNKQEL